MATTRLLWASSKAASFLKISTFNRGFASSVLKDLKYADSHEWAKVEGNCATIGITDHAQDHLGDVVYVELPEVGAEVTQGSSFGAVESVKATGDINSPVSGKVTEVNEELSSSPGLVNGSPYENGWIMKVEISDKNEIKQFNEPIEVKITEWNTGGLLTRFEGLRAFLPKVELVNRVNNFTELKENVGRRMYAQITRISEDTNDLILSQKEAWNAIHLKEGTLLEGTVRKIFPYGAQIRIGETNRSGLLHISNITRGEFVSVSDVLAIDEKVKVLVVKSMFPDKISLSTAELESEPDLFLRNKEKVYLEAAEMAKKYRQKLPAISIRCPAI